MSFLNVSTPGPVGYQTFMSLGHPELPSNYETYESARPTHLLNHLGKRKHLKLQLVIFPELIHIIILSYQGL